MDAAYAIIEIASYFNIYAAAVSFVWWLWKDEPTKEEILNRCAVDGVLELEYFKITKAVSFVSKKGEKIVSLILSIVDYVLH